jgi:hypothetical protein
MKMAVDREILRSPPESGHAPDVVGKPGIPRKFALCHQTILLGQTPMDYWWMAPGTVYPTRKRKAANYEPIIEHYWALCLKGKTVFEDDVQENYILAKLLPHARSNASRKVFVDSVPSTRRDQETYPEPITEHFDRLLRHDRRRRMGPVKFRDCTADAIGPTCYPKAIQDLYRRRSEELLGEGRDALEASGAEGLRVPLSRWRKWMDGIGRHRGQTDEKKVLDVLSYECRAALHRCYSAVWYDLIGQIAEQHGEPREWRRFHLFWHTEQLRRARETDKAEFNLFHGHVFALHPAARRFLLTDTGRELLEEWLIKSPRSKHPMQRVLYGLQLAVWQYAIQQNVYAELRKKAPKTYGSEKLESLAHQPGYARRRPKKRPTDAR